MNYNLTQKAMPTKVNINKASSKELQEIIHIGPVRANDIIMHRKMYSAGYRDIHELSSIPGLGAIRMADIINQGVATV
jgi:DNA uptake protein ComE-like DNA-binding protein